jgi:pyruvate kinase
VDSVRAAATANGREVAVMVDLQGPKIRIGGFAHGPIELLPGAQFQLDADCGAREGNQTRVGLTYKTLPDDVQAGDRLLIDDGLIDLTVESVKGRVIHCTVGRGGVLSDSKGINRLGGGLSAGALTDKDRTDIQMAADLGADYLALSFPRDAADVEEARTLFQAAGGTGGIIAKIERAEAVTNAEEIIRAADAIMVARGDLGVEIGDAELPGVQKHLIGLARDMDRAVITATQMMQSMVESQVATRAEVFDVANAVLDGTDAVMLSAETAAGKYPVLAVEAMARACVGAENQRASQVSGHRMERTFQRVDEAIAMATMYTANHLGVRAIAALTESGDTPLWMSRISSGIPIFALTKHRSTQRRVTLYRGVYPVEFCTESKSHYVVNREAIEVMLAHGVVAEGDLVIITKGDLVGVHGGTSAMKIVRVGNLSNLDS